MKRLVALIVMLCIVLSHAACGQPPAATAPVGPDVTEPLASAPLPERPDETREAPWLLPWPRTLYDIQGNELQLDKPAERIVSLSPGVTEILFAVGAGERIVGADTWSDYPEAAQSIERVGDFSSPSVEKIVALEPDIVLCAHTLQDEQAQALRSMGLTVAIADARAFEDILASIRFVGALLPDKNDKMAGNLAAALFDRERAVSDVAKSLVGRPTVYYVMSMGSAGNWTSGPGSFINDMMETAGGEPITFDADSAWIEFSLEMLVERDPDILFVSSDFSLDDLKNAAGYSELSAVKNGSVFPLDAAVSSRPGPRIFDALEQIAAAIGGWPSMMLDPYAAAPSLASSQMMHNRFYA